jgi:HK97 family phage major capsid protein
MKPQRCDDRDFASYASAPAGAGVLGALLGRPAVLVQVAPSIVATHTALVSGDFGAYYMLRSVTGNACGFQIARDRYTFLISKGAVAFIGYGRGGSFVTDAGTHPVKVLTQHA